MKIFLEIQDEKNLERAIRIRSNVDYLGEARAEGDESTRLNDE